MGMQKILSNETYMKCLSLAKTALEKPEGIFIKCASKAEAVRYRALFFSVRRKLGYKEGQIPAMAMGLYVVEFRFFEQEDGKVDLQIRRAGSSLDALEIVDSEGKNVQLENVNKGSLETEKLDYLLQLERIKYFLLMACPSRANKANVADIYTTALYLYNQGTRICGNIPPLAQAEAAYTENYDFVEAQVGNIGDILEESGDIFPDIAWETLDTRQSRVQEQEIFPAPSFKKKNLSRKVREEPFDLQNFNLDA
jgi:hypothetical protein